jgi:peptidoglycan/xylan/chitin deacetylase (PgdA/CDA1 family)
MNNKVMAGKKYKLSLAEKTGMAALLIAVPLFFIAPAWAVSVLLLFLACCLVAPFFPGFGFFLPVLSFGTTGTRSIALTFDDGPSPASTPVLLQLLAKYNLKATFFVIGQQAEQYPELIDQIVAAGHNVGNHSWRHDNLLMFRSIKVLAKDIKQTQDVLAGAGVRPLAFRPPVGITGPRLRQVMDDQEMFTVNFSCRIFDRGNRNIKNLADRILARLEPGDILLLHDSFPQSVELGKCWQDELDRFFRKLVHQYKILPLEELIGRPVMVKLS